MEKIYSEEGGGSLTVESVLWAVYKCRSEIRLTLQLLNQAMNSGVYVLFCVNTILSVSCNSCVETMSETKV